MAEAAPRLQSRKGAPNCGRVRSAASYGSRPTAVMRRDATGMGSIAARTGHFCLPLVRGAMGAPRTVQAQEREGRSHSPTFPWYTPEFRPCHWRGRDRRLGFWCHHALPFSARWYSLGLASSSRAAIEKRRPNGLLNGFMSLLGQFSRPCHGPHRPPSSDRPSRAPRRRQRPRSYDGTACWGSFLRPSSLSEPDSWARCLIARSIAPGQLPLSQTQRRWKKVVGGGR
ncbi:hypothetical protein B0T18DRAFT_20719 [Schizothecium vesticola]|uniref:Uncharacterized protein n=1 Tax=Schizothecium vesticola TaxID=314040 RepID=A0AA40F9H3_9PEZI|nr:hypothetical protein B0T18DRAFT_20719 [Schizothecium vesticola]